MNDLSIAEELLLIALDDETGKLLPLPDRALDYGLAGAVIADLTREGRLEVTEERIVVKDCRPIDSATQDLGLKELVESKVESLRTALAHLAGDGHTLRKRITQQLLEKGILEEKDKEILWVFHVSRYPLAEKGEEEAVKDRLRRGISGGEALMSPRDHVLLSLIHACQLSHIIFTEEEIAANREQIEQAAEHDKIGSAVRECLIEIQRAILEIRNYSSL